MEHVRERPLRADLSGWTAEALRELAANAEHHLSEVARSELEKRTPRARTEYSEEFHRPIRT